MGCVNIWWAPFPALLPAFVQIVLYPSHSFCWRLLANVSHRASLVNAGLLREFVSCASSGTKGVAAFRIAGFEETVQLRGIGIDRGIR